jgi:tRNA pseudouridine13 synthase
MTDAGTELPGTVPEGDLTAALPYAFGPPPATGVLRTAPEDFVVEEILGYAATGEGEHVVVEVRKRNLNTHDVAERLARLAGVRLGDVGYAGRKDKLALTTQSFSVHLPGKPEPDWAALADADMTVIGAVRHNRKIRRGSLRGNRFTLRLRDVGGERGALAHRLGVVAEAGVPNYFGAQRFGTGGQNLVRAAQLLGGRRRFNRNQLNILLSAVRSWLFNRVLALRVQRGDWDQVLEGDVMQLAGTRRLFVPEDYDATIGQRMRERDIHATGPLVGRDSRAPAATGAAADAEKEALAGADFWIDGLCRAGLDADRRALRLPVQELEWSFEAQDLVLRFALEAGAFATSVVREIAVVPRARADSPDAGARG